MNRKPKATRPGRPFLRRLPLFLGLAALAVTVWAPFWLLLSGSLMGGDEVARNLGPALTTAPGDRFACWPLLPRRPTPAPFLELLLDTPQFFTMFWNSCSQVFPVLAGQVLFGAPAAWALSRYRFRGRRLLAGLYIALMLLPFQVTMVSGYLALDRLRLVDTAWAIILPGAFSTFPVFIMMRFFGAIPPSLLEAAALDGAGPLRAFVLIGLPAGAPGVLSAVVLGFLEYWNALEPPLAFLHDKTLWPLSLYLPRISAENAGVSLAASVIMLTPALLLFLFGQSYLEQGIAASGLRE